MSLKFLCVFDHGNNYVVKADSLLDAVLSLDEIKPYKEQFKDSKIDDWLDIDDFNPDDKSKLTYRASWNDDHAVQVFCINHLI